MGRSGAIFKYVKDQCSSVTVKKLFFTLLSELYPYTVNTPSPDLGTTKTAWPLLCYSGQRIEFRGPYRRLASQLLKTTGWQCGVGGVALCGLKVPEGDRHASARAVLRMDSNSTMGTPWTGAHVLSEQTVLREARKCFLYGVSQFLFFLRVSRHSYSRPQALKEFPDLLKLYDQNTAFSSKFKLLPILKSHHLAFKLRSVEFSSLEQSGVTKGKKPITRQHLLGGPGPDKGNCSKINSRPAYPSEFLLETALLPAEIFSTLRYSVHFNLILQVLFL